MLARLIRHANDIRVPFVEHPEATFLVLTAAGVPHQALHNISRSTSAPREPLLVRQLHERRQQDHPESRLDPPHRPFAAVAAHLVVEVDLVEIHCAVAVRADHHHQPVDALQIGWREHGDLISPLVDQHARRETPRAP